MIPSPRRGFSLLELILTIAVLAVLVGLLVPAVQRARDASLRMHCVNNLKQMGLALIQYHDTNLALPPGVSTESGPFPYPYLSWSARLLPFLEQAALWQATEQAFAQNSNFIADPPHVGFSTIVSVFVCPADPRNGRTTAQGAVSKAALTSYLGLEGTNQTTHDGLLYEDSSVRFLDITDGASNTLLVGERPASADGILGWWYGGWGQSKDGSGDTVLGVEELNVSAGEPWGENNGKVCPPGPYAFLPGALNNQCDAFHYWSVHFNGGSHFLMADGSVHFLRYSAVNVLSALATRGGGEDATVPD